MRNVRSSLIKREQRKSFLLRHLSSTLHALYEEAPQFGVLFVSRVDLSDDGGICYVYLNAAQANQEKSSREIVENLIPELILYKPSIRKSLGDALQKRYVPDVKFLFDEKWEKVDKINQLLDKVQQDLHEHDDQPKSSGEDD